MIVSWPKLVANKLNNKNIVVFDLKKINLLFSVISITQRDDLYKKGIVYVLKIGL